MKNACALVIVLMGLASCNTTIGLGRDVRDGFNWTKEKIQQSGGGGHGDAHAPVY